MAAESSAGTTVQSDRAMTFPSMVLPGLGFAVFFLGLDLFSYANQEVHELRKTVWPCC